LYSKNNIKEGQNLYTILLVPLTKLIF